LLKKESSKLYSCFSQYLIYLNYCHFSKCCCFVVVVIVLYGIVVAVVVKERIQHIPLIFPIHDTIHLQVVIVFAIVVVIVSVFAFGIVFVYNIIFSC